MQKPLTSASWHIWDKQTFITKKETGTVRIPVSFLFVVSAPKYLYRREATP